MNKTSLALGVFLGILLSLVPLVVTPKVTQEDIPVKNTECRLNILRVMVGIKEAASREEQAEATALNNALTNSVAKDSDYIADTLDSILVVYCKE